MAKKKKTKKKELTEPTEVKEVKDVKEEVIDSPPAMGEPEGATESDDAAIEEGLNAIYGKEKIDFSKIKRSNLRLTNVLLTIVITLAVIAATAWTGFFIYTKYFTADEAEKFNIEIEADEEIVSGAKTKFAIHYDNPTAVPIASLEIEARLPSAFELLAVTPAPTAEDEMKWSVGSLNPGSDGTIWIEGVWIAGTPSETPIQAFANYRPANFNADFQEIETTYIKTLESVLVPSIEGAEEGRPGEALDYRIEVRNSGTEALSNIEVKLALPDGFFLDSSNPVVEAGRPPEWSFEKIESEGTQEITFSGSFAADSDGFQYFGVTIFVQSEEQSFEQATAQSFTDVVGQSLSLQLVVNGSTNDITAEQGGSLRASLSFENVGSSDLENLSLLLDFQSDRSIPILWSNSELDGGVMKSEGILWDAETVGILTAGEKRVLNLLFPIHESVGGDKADTFNVIASGTLGDLTIRSTPVEVSINSEADFSAEVRYYTGQGAPLGTGPMPPEVGKVTVYRVFWNIENSLHDLDAISVQGILPPHVDWIDQKGTDLGSITYDELTRTVTWNIAHLPKTVTEIEATFAISITPDANDVGTFVKLISGSTFKATDSTTESAITESTESITTELPDDSFAAGKGTVVE